MRGTLFFHSFVYALNYDEHGLTSELGIIHLHVVAAHRDKLKTVVLVFVINSVGRLGSRCVQSTFSSFVI